MLLHYSLEKYICNWVRGLNFQNATHIFVSKKIAIHILDLQYYNIAKKNQQAIIHLLLHCNVCNKLQCWNGDMHFHYLHDQYPKCDLGHFCHNIDIDLISNFVSCAMTLEIYDSFLEHVFWCSGKLSWCHFATSYFNIEQVKMSSASATPPMFQNEDFEVFVDNQNYTRIYSNNKLVFESKCLYKQKAFSNVKWLFDKSILCIIVHFATNKFHILCYHVNLQKEKNHIVSCKSITCPIIFPIDDTKYLVYTDCNGLCLASFNCEQNKFIKIFDKQVPLAKEPFEYKLGKLQIYYETEFENNEKIQFVDLFDINLTQARKLSYYFA